MTYTFGWYVHGSAYPLSVYHYGYPKTLLETPKEVFFLSTFELHQSLLLDKDTQEFSLCASASLPGL